MAKLAQEPRTCGLYTAALAGDMHNMLAPVLRTRAYLLALSHSQTRLLASPTQAQNTRRLPPAQDSTL